MRWTGVVAVSLVALLWGCNAKRDQLVSKIDSLKAEIKVQREVEKTLQAVAVLVDSIDVSRNSLDLSGLRDKSSYKNFIQRLDQINVYIGETKQRIDQLESAIQKNNTNYAPLIKKARKDVEFRSEQIASLETEADRINSENIAMLQTIVDTDSLLTEVTDEIAIKKQSLETLESQFAEMKLQEQEDEADRYFAEAQALETVAQRTKFAPNKKKDTERQALELYKRSHSLGKTEALTKIRELQKSQSQ